MLRGDFEGSDVRNRIESLFLNSFSVNENREDEHDIHTHITSVSSRP